MILYVVHARFNPDRFTQAYVFHLIGVFNDIFPIQNAILEYCQTKIIAIRREQLVTDFSNIIQSDDGCHSFQIIKCLLNNDSSVLYEPGSEIYNDCQEKISQLSNN